MWSLPSVKARGVSIIFCAYRVPRCECFCILYTFEPLLSGAATSVACTDRANNGACIPKTLKAEHTAPPPHHRNAAQQNLRCWKYNLDNCRRRITMQLHKVLFNFIDQQAIRTDWHTCGILFLSTAFGSDERFGKRVLKKCIMFIVLVFHLSKKKKKKWVA